MDCQEARDVMHAYFDGELDLVRTLDFERHIHDCQSCSRAHKGLMAMRSSIRGSGLYFKAPLGLEQRIRADVRKARGEAQGRPVSIVWRWMAMAASVAFIAFALWTLVRTP